MNKKGLYRRKALRVARPYVVGEDMCDIRFLRSVSPKEGGMILTDKFGSKWYMSEELFNENFEPGGIDQATTEKARGVDAELRYLRDRLESLESALYGRRAD